MNNCLPFEDTSYFSSLIVDYLNQDAALQDFYHRFPSLENLTEQARAQQSHFSSEDRQVLAESLKKQYKNLSHSDATAQNLKKLVAENTFTVTTGHQLNLFSGPLYFIYKIISTVNLCEKWNKSQNEFQGVPVFWMASEDHDFEEINFFNYKKQPVVWNREASGPVGRFSLKNMQGVAENFADLLDDSKQARYLLNLFKESYEQHENLADATRYLAHELFKDYGLIIIDGDDTAFKRRFSPYMKNELLEQNCNRAIGKSNEKLKNAGYHIQVQQREINLFYITDNLRSRIVQNERGKYAVLDTDIEFSQEGILEELEEHPERFSPNAVMRPLYQEKILPNLCYIGGGGELAYWFQLKDYFESQQIDFPILLLRNSVLWITAKQKRKLKNLGREAKDLFQTKSDLRGQHTREISEIDIDFSPQRKYLEQQFSNLYTLAKKTDASFEGAVAAQEKKQLNGLDHLEKRLLTAQKRKLSDELDRLTDLQEDLFPRENLQERVENFSTFYREYGLAFIETLKKKLDPLALKFRILGE